MAAPLYARAAEDKADPHTVGAPRCGRRGVGRRGRDADVGAHEVDADPLNRKGRAELVARRARAVVETAVDESINRTGRALGPGPLALDGSHAQRVADLSIYVRQSHAERDLERLGQLAGTGA